MERNLYFKLRFLFQNYLRAQFGDGFEPRMVEDLLAVVEEAEKETA